MSDGRIGAPAWWELALQEMESASKTAEPELAEFYRTLSIRLWLAHRHPAQEE